MCVTIRHFLALVIASVGLGGATMSRGADTTQAVVDCQKYAAIDERLTCYDDIAMQLKLSGQDSKALAASGSDSTGEESTDIQDEENQTATDGTPQSLDATAMNKRFQFEEEVGGNSFIIIPHLPNYILLSSYNDMPNQHPYSPTHEGGDEFEGIKRTETKFQISFKVQLARNLLPERTSVWFAYTQKSFWQLYDQAGSAPFRESNYEPELIFLYREKLNLFGFASETYAVGVIHQSNGRSDPLSRSWNRVFAGFLFSRGNLSLSLRPWWRLPEDAEDDDNPDIERYLGNAEYGITYKREDKDAIYHLRFFNNLRDHDNKTSVELSYSFPLGGRIKGYVQYYNGYGESLIDYNHRTHRIGIGVLLTDWY